MHSQGIVYLIFQLERVMQEFLGTNAELGTGFAT